MRSFYYCLPVAEKCLEKCLKGGGGFELCTDNFSLSTLHFCKYLWLTRVDFESLFYCIVMSHIGKMGIFFLKIWFKFCILIDIVCDFEALYNFWRNLWVIIRFAPFSGSLHVITVAQTEPFNLVPRKKLCSQCCISLHKNKEENYEFSECSSDSICQNDEAMKDQLNTSLTSLDSSPIKFFASTKQLETVDNTTKGYMGNFWSRSHWSRS